MLDDLEVFMAVEVVVEEDEAKEFCLVRSWSPDLGSPTLVAPDLIMAAFQLTTPVQRTEENVDKQTLTFHPQVFTYS